MTTKKALFVEGNREIKSIVCLDPEKAVSFAKGTKREKDTYRRFRYNGIVFICDDETFFETPVAEMGYVKLLEYQETVDVDGKEELVNRLEFDSYGLKEEDLAEREHQVAMENIGRETLKVDDALMERLKALETASVE